MPIYEYKCPKCKVIHEVFQPINGDHSLKCPDCKVDAERKFSPFGFKFDFKYGWDAGLGTYVDSKKQREETLRSKGLRKVS